MIDVKVSTITPVYNGEKYLRKCLDKLLLQTLENVEFIFIDDGSKDNSVKIIRKYQEKDSRIVLLTQNHQGSGPARNLGIKTAKGEFVAFLDCDDEFEGENVLKDLYEKAKEQNVLVCGGKYRNHFDPKNTSKYSFDNLFFTNKIVSYSDYQNLSFYWKYIYNRKFLIDNDLYFPPYLRAQDPIWFVKTMFLAKEFYAMGRIVYVYTAKNITEVDWTIEKYSDHLDGIRDVLEFAHKHNLQKLYNRAYSWACRFIACTKFYKQNDMQKKIDNIFAQLNLEMLEKDINKDSIIKNVQEFNAYIKRHYGLLGRLKLLYSKLLKIFFCYKLIEW